MATGDCDWCEQCDDTEDDVRVMQLAQQLLKQHGRQLTYSIIHASVFQLPSNMLTRVAEFLASLASTMKEVHHTLQSTDMRSKTICCGLYY